MAKKPKIVMSRLEALMSTATAKTYRGKHVKKCQCYECLKKKVAAYEARTRQALRGGAVITSLDQTVPVRAHFRAQPHHLANDPELRQAVERILRDLLRNSQRFTA